MTEQEIRDAFNDEILKKAQERLAELREASYDPGWLFAQNLGITQGDMYAIARGTVKSTHGIRKLSAVLRLAGIDID